jgi:hypothetical protein
MASYALLLALSGFDFDTVKGYIGFNPKIKTENFSCFWSVDSGWGIFQMTPDSLYLTVKYGHITLSAFSCDVFKDKEVKSVYIEERKIEFTQENEYIRFQKSASVFTDETLHVSAS